LLKASEAHGRSFFFNLETSLIDRSLTNDGLFYPEWSVGLLLGDKFEEIYQFSGQ